MQSEWSCHSHPRLVEVESLHQSVTEARQVVWEVPISLAILEVTLAMDVNTALYTFNGS